MSSMRDILYDDELTPPVAPPIAPQIPVSDGRFKLYVWFDVLSDWTSGIAFAIAQSEDDAREMVKEHVSHWRHAEFNQEPTIFDLATMQAPFAYTLSGGS